MELRKGWCNDNSMLDTSTYEIEFPDGRSDDYTVNAIAENMYAQWGAEGNQYNLMEIIIDHKTDGHALDHTDMYIRHGSKNQFRKTTKGWHLCFEWRDGTIRKYNCGHHCPR
jgi:hypothetical protein